MISARTQLPIFVVDDDQTTRHLLDHTLERSGLLSVQFSSAEEFLQSADQHRFEARCLILDVQMPGTGGLGLQAILNREGVTIPIIFFSNVSEMAVVVQAMKAGAVDFLPKNLAWEKLVARVLRAIELDDQQSADRTASRDYREKLQSLTAQERRVHDLLAEGKTSKEVGRILAICIPTVARHRSSVFRKMTARSAVDLARASWLFGSSSRKSHSNEQANRNHFFDPLREPFRYRSTTSLLPQSSGEKEAPAALSPVRFPREESLSENSRSTECRQ